MKIQIEKNIDGRARKLMLDGEQTIKVWICLFTCAVTRAVHIEVIYDTITTVFICALKRVILRRGPIKLIISDNATTFHAAERLLSMFHVNAKTTDFSAILRTDGEDFGNESFRKTTASYNDREFRATSSGRLSSKLRGVTGLKIVIDLPKAGLTSNRGCSRPASAIFNVEILFLPN